MEVAMQRTTQALSFYDIMKSRPLEPGRFQLIGRKSLNGRMRRPVYAD
jgi:hypothetical protein